MSDSLLLLLALLPPAFLLLALIAGVLPSRVGGTVSIGLSGVGLLLSLATVLTRVDPAALMLPAGPPNLSLHLALDALSGCFLVLAMGAATCAMAVLASGPTQQAALRPGAVCIAGVLLVLLAGDGMTLSIGLALACASVWLDPGQPRGGALLIPLLLLASVSLLTPADFAPRFDTIRAAPPQLVHASGGALLAIVGLSALIAVPAAGRCPVRDALHAGMVLPAAVYGLLRLVLDVSASAAQPLWGGIMMLAGGAIAVRQGWAAGSAREVDQIADALARTQAGLSVAGCGLALQCRLADLPIGAGDALAGTLLLASSTLAAMLVTLTAHAAAASAGTYRLSRLGGLLGLMPATATALSGGLLALSAVPSSLGFAAIWLLLRAVVAAPRTEGLLAQCVLALTAAAIAAAAALATTAALRLGGIAVLSRPRTPRGSGAREVWATARGVLLGLSGFTLLIGIFPGPFLSVLAQPVVRNLTGVSVGFHGGAFGHGSAYLALPVTALLGFCIGLVLLVRLWRRRETRVAPAWLDGMEPPYGLPFGDPVAQSAGRGFVPSMPPLPWRLPKRPALPAWLPNWPWPQSQTGLWLILLGAAACLIVLALGGGSG